jgi:mannose-6-phosphate isomerase-like protein (cupin superfamily)
MRWLMHATSGTHDSDIESRLAMTMTSHVAPAAVCGKTYQPVNFDAKLALLHEHWQPRVIAEMNDYQFKIVKVLGDFLWHDHAGTDETFIVVAGVLRIDMRDGAVTLRAGEMFVVPRGVEHKPYAEHEVQILVIEPRGVANTGSQESDRRAEDDVWI